MLRDISVSPNHECSRAKRKEPALPLSDLDAFNFDAAQLDEDSGGAGRLENFLVLEAGHRGFPVCHKDSGQAVFIKAECHAEQFSAPSLGEVLALFPSLKIERHVPGANIAVLGDDPRGEPAPAVRSAMGSQSQIGIGLLGKRTGRS